MRKRSLHLEQQTDRLRHTGKIIGMMRGVASDHKKTPVNSKDVPVDSERVRAYHVRSDSTARVRRSREASQVQYIATHPACHVTRSSSRNGVLGVFCQMTPLPHQDSINDANLISVCACVLPSQGGEDRRESRANCSRTGSKCASTSRIRARSGSQMPRIAQSLTINADAV